mmetsp:Transcript_23469/g.54534  ORF Transcript_23469/g.54534 Transcript_23469/m.54534 type:complete len:269 (-) Transcript_23469:95-901(-)
MATIHELAKPPHQTRPVVRVGWTFRNSDTSLHHAILVTPRDKNTIHIISSHSPNAITRPGGIDRVVLVASTGIVDVDGVHLTLIRTADTCKPKIQFTLKQLHIQLLTTKVLHEGWRTRKQKDRSSNGVPIIWRQLIPGTPVDTCFLRAGRKFLPFPDRRMLKFGENGISCILNSFCSIVAPHPSALIPNPVIPQSIQDMRRVRELVADRRTLSNHKLLHEIDRLFFISLPSFSNCPIGTLAVELHDEILQEVNQLVHCINNPTKFHLL